MRQIDPQLYLSGGSDWENESGHSGTAEVQQTTLDRREKTKQKQQHKVRVQVKNTHAGSCLCVKMYLLGGIMKRNQ